MEQLERSDDEDLNRLPISCDDMSELEKNSFIQFLVTESHKKDLQNSSLQKTIDDLVDRLNTVQLTLDAIRSAQHDTLSENIKLNAQLVMQGNNLKKLSADSCANCQSIAESPS
ncbi:MAG: hypothetical protein RR371_01680 [Bacteroides sp.]